MSAKRLDHLDQSICFENIEYREFSVFCEINVWELHHAEKSVFFAFGEKCLQKIWQLILNEICLCSSIKVIWKKVWPDLKIAHWNVTETMQQKKCLNLRRYLPSCSQILLPTHLWPPILEGALSNSVQIFILPEQEIMRIVYAVNSAWKWPRPFTEYGRKMKHFADIVREILRKFY